MNMSARSLDILLLTISEMLLYMSREWQNLRRSVLPPPSYSETGQVTKTNTRPDTTECLVPALGLVRDTSRGRTHIIYQEVEHVPSAKNPLDKFRSTRIGVFKQEDVWKDLESRLGPDSGDAKMHIREMLKEFDTGPGKERVGRKAHVPIFNLMFSSKNKVDVYLRMCVLFLSLDRSLAMLLPNLGEITQRDLVLIRPKPDWRRFVNVKGEPSIHIQLCDGKIPDAEFIF
ncbi:uncharacterized protein EV420DRAFT_527079 [Desarmillaria tabescens]|uniref:Uncharacterized protein n=1 Tax=Armillaria tabescens TaxID=1929756 RepID=A0AA39J008_ARMTA|nr:uncharacterized protein EV420DRAFT_527079 [Desarmillaria tabescens]KAK0433583.1 hypothetical protein EV420DRAFT_527079 [Desarmillaria tabescens]